MTNKVQSSHYENENLKQIFENEIVSIKKRININLKSLDEIDTNPTDPLDKAQSNQEMIDVNQTNHILQEKLKKLSIALHKLNNNLDYGDCSECGIDIPKERLKAIPESTHCVDCLHIKEKKEACYMH